MNLVDLKEFITDIIAAKGILGVNPSIALDALRKTAIDFCTQTGVWEYDDGFKTQANVADYPIGVPNESRVASMAWVSVGGNRLNPLASSPRFNTWPRGRDPNNAYGTGYNTFAMEGKDFVWISPIPQDDATIVRFGAALKPTQTACSLPDFLYQDYNDALTSGTAFRLFSIPKQEWSNAGLAALNHKEYTRWIGRARLTKAQGNAQVTLTMSGSYF